MQSQTSAMALDSTHSFRLSLWSDPLAVRDATRKSCQQWSAWGIDEVQCATAELVLAEVLNNVVEHAHQDQRHGSLVILCACEGDALDFEVRDDGLPMPKGQLPEGKLKEIGPELEDLPEGGFGWHLIRSLTQELTYRRKDSWNVLTFRMVPDD